MARAKLIDRLQQDVFFVDGAMGTELVARGMDPMKCSDYQNIESPELVAGVHEAYFAAGTDAVITNTFGANAIALKRHGIEGQARAVSKAGAEVARRAAGEDRYVIGDIGPCGDFLEPLGMVKEDELKAAFAEQAQGLFEGGADGVIIETMTAVDEIAVAIDAVKSVSDLPIFVSLAYDPAGDEFRTMMGVDPAAAVDTLGGKGIAAIGFNCGTLSMEQYEQLAAAYKAAVSGGLLVLAEPNAGKPALEGDKAVYTLSPEDFAKSVKVIAQNGAGILGGCCGTTPAHIEAAVKAVRG